MRECTSHEHEVALHDLTDQVAEAIEGTDSEILRLASNLDILDQDFQHRIRCVEETQREFQCFAGELRETQILLLQTDDAVTQLRDQWAEAHPVPSNLYQQPALPLSSQQQNRAVSPSPTRRASPGASRRIIRQLVLQPVRSYIMPSAAVAIERPAGPRW